MMVDKARLGRNFGRQAGRYDQHARVQRHMAEQLIRQLQARDRPWKRILEIGCGTGYLTERLRKTFPRAHLTALDLAPAVIQEARRRLGKDPRLAWVVADGEQPLGGSFDLITSNSVFQWFSQPAQTCRQYWERLNPGGWLIFSTLGPATFQELTFSLEEAVRQTTTHGDRPTLNPPIPAVGFADAASWQRFLLQAGFGGVMVQRQPRVETYPTVREFLKAIQGLGATRTPPAYIPPRLFKEMIALYETSYRVNGAVPVTYEIIWARANKC